MRRQLSATLLALLLGFTIPVKAAVSPGDFEQLLQRAEFLLNNYKETEALKVYEKVLHMAPDNLEALCKASYLHNRIGDRFSSNDSRQLEHFTMARQYAERAYAVNPKEAESNYVLAMSLSNLATVVGPKQRLVLTSNMKTYLDAAIEQNPNHAGAWHLLGRWQYKMANLNFAEIVATKMFVGTSPCSITNTDAIHSLRSAIAYNPQNIRYYYDLATVYNELKDITGCKETLQQAMQVELETKEEYELSRRCKMMLEEFNR